MSDNERYKPYYQQWDEKAFISEMAVQHMCFEEEAFYRRLLQQCFVQPESIRPALPNDDEQLWKIAGAKSIKHWQKHKTAVVAMFYEDQVEVRNSDRSFDVSLVPVLRQKRVERDFAQLLNFRKIQREKGMLGGRPKVVENTELTETYG